MTQAMTNEKTILEKLHTLTPQQQQSVINFIEFLQFKAQKKEITEEEPIYAYESAKDLVGCVESGPGDLATNKEKMAWEQLETLIGVWKNQPELDDIFSEIDRERHSS
ncbi:hypothetical protein [Microcystis aeruginosa]|jgi:hypothetical protein|uniref:DUF2281 domain-containing protein n=1 Tax=Microcystis aeruginosa FD4 TaxID=2686288 RepID=A0A857D826_MICAE|nr:hypothetical protein [Microcystis aeruginosa]MDB9421390.1 hypothetical protein [Microcystis aeruginosa CS-563/04]NCR08745.1 hypothetical protein [Microcystis aeruginosa LG13-11]QGZ91743.1 hypothetical protein GQR42_21680 [Microcystis aeruginosa FD4]